jgi:RHH-type transcriptional regulator, rel operon repressor / antitoxin RelB
LWWKGGQGGTDGGQYNGPAAREDHVNPKDAETTVVQLRLSKSTAEQIEHLAQTTGQDQSQLAEEALRQYVAFETEQLAKIHRGLDDAKAGRFATDEQIEATFNRYRAYRTKQAG